MDKILPHLHWILLLYGGWSFFEAYEDYEVNLQMAETQLSSVEASLMAKKRRVQEIESYQKRMEESEEDLKKVEVELEKLKASLISDGEQTEVLQDLSNEGKALNMQNLSFNPKQKISKGLYFINAMEMKATGTYLQMLIFFERLGHADRIYNISSLKLIGEKGKTVGRLNFVEMDTIIETYQYNENFKDQDLKLEESQQAKGDPAQRRGRRK